MAEFKSQSESHQDTFAYNVLGRPSHGYFLDIGAGPPVVGNNTYALEQVGWEGLSVDIKEYGAAWCGVRQTQYVQGDGRLVDLESLLAGYPDLIDYLSIDTDEHSFQCLEHVLSYRHDSKVITIEHDAYRFGETLRGPERAILHELGYTLAVADVLAGGVSPYEDWWLHPSVYVPARHPALVSPTWEEVVARYGFAG